MKEVEQPDLQSPKPDPQLTYRAIHNISVWSGKVGPLCLEKLQPPHDLGAGPVIERVNKLPSRLVPALRPVELDHVRLRHTSRIQGMTCLHKSGSNIDVGGLHDCIR